MKAFVDIDCLRAAAFADGHKIQAVILRGDFAGDVCVATPNGSLYAFCPNHYKMRKPKTSRRAGAAIRALRASSYYRWHVGPPAPPIIEESESIRLARHWLGLPEKEAA